MLYSSYFRTKTHGWFQLGTQDTLLIHWLFLRLQLAVVQVQHRCLSFQVSDDGGVGRKHQQQQNNACLPMLLLLLVLFLVPGALTLLHLHILDKRTIKPTYDVEATRLAKLLCFSFIFIKPCSLFANHNPISNSLGVCSPPSSLVEITQQRSELSTIVVGHGSLFPGF